MPILPEPQRRGEVKFIFAKSLRYDVRLALIVIFLVAGVAVQIFSEKVWWGAPLLAVGVSLSLVQGYDNKLRSAPQNKRWERVTRKEFERVLELNRRAKSWDQTFIDITCGRGFIALVALVGIGIYIYSVLSSSGAHFAAQMWVLDGAILILPQWVVGVRSILKNAPLVIKIQNLLSVADTFAAISKRGEELQYMLEIGETKAGKTPVDAKMVLVFHEGSSDFLGLQLQLAINDVQGTDYPYFYCVLVARPAFALLKKSQSAAPPNVTIERKHEGEVDIVVIRQTTTKTSGYYTKPNVVRTLFLYALAEARMALAK